MQNIDRYIATKLAPRGLDALERNRHAEIEEVRRNRCLSPFGESLFRDSVSCYLAHLTEEGDELAAKSRAFLELAHSTSEKQQYYYTKDHGEGQRAAALTYVRWLADGSTSPALLDDSRQHLYLYYSHTREFDRVSATLETPVLLYTESYP